MFCWVAVLGNSTLSNRGILFGGVVNFQSPAFLSRREQSQQLRFESSNELSRLYRLIDAALPVTAFYAVRFDFFNRSAQASATASKMPIR